MKIINTISRFLVLIFLAFPLQAICQDLSTMFKEAEHLEELRKENEALKKYLEILSVQPSSLTALCKVSELYTTIGSRIPDKDQKLAYFRTARSYAEKALRVNPNYSNANFVMALAMGRMALLLSGHEKIKAVNDIKKYAENAVRTDPNNFKAYHVLGKWNYEVSSLSSFERMGARLLFGGLQPASYEESIKNYEKSRSLNPGFALNYLEVAKAYHMNDQDKKAIELLQKLQTLPVKTADDPRIKVAGNKLLKELQENNP